MNETGMTQVRRDGDPAFPTIKENENSSDSSTEKTNIDPTHSSDENKETDVNKKDGEKEPNLADHPRWKEREEDWKKRFNDSEVRHTSELQKLREEFLGKSDKKDTTPSTIPAWFGGDEDQWKSYQEYEKGKVDRLREETLQEFSKRSESEQKKIDEATEYMNQEVAALESDKDVNPEGHKIDRNKLLKYVLDNELVNTKGQWNYRAAFKMMNPKEVFKAKEALNEKRKIANATNSENRAESKSPEYMTSADFKKPGTRPW